MSDLLQDVLWCLWKIHANSHCDQLVAELNARVELQLVLAKVETGVCGIHL